MYPYAMMYPPYFNMGFPFEKKKTRNQSPHMSKRIQRIFEEIEDEMVSKFAEKWREFEKKDKDKKDDGKKPKEYFTKVETFILLTIGGLAYHFLGPWLDQYLPHFIK